jgi:hypothetical protein
MSQPGQNPANQPISFKTVPGRNRTQKWTQAKTNNYDGDDWGGYDEYDDYGGQQEPSYAQQQPQQLQRQSSFDRGVDTERRQFSSGTAIHDSERYTSPSGSAGRVGQDGGSPDETRRRMREFSNPGQVPQPLNTPRSPVAPGSVDRPPRKSSLGSPSPDARPIPVATSPNADKPLPFIRPSDIYKRMAEEQQRERQSMESGRPSMDSVNRDAGSPALSQNALSPQKSQGSLGRRPSLGPVSENMEPALPEQPMPVSSQRMPPGATTIQTTVQPMTPGYDPSRPSETSPRLPPVTRLSGFGSFMPSDEEERLSAVGLAASTAAANAAASALSSGSRDITPTMPAKSGYDTYDSSSDPAAEIAAERSTDAPVEQLGRSADEDPSGLSHQPSSGFRSVVHKAFDRQADGSVPASPISRDNTQSVVSRSDTNSTRSISPIMSRVPSAATAQQRQQERDAVVPPIAEETPLEVARSRPTPTSPALSSRTSIMRKPTPSHSRNVSSEIVGFTPGYRRSMDTPSPNNSPARTPALGDTDHRRLSGPMSAITVNDPEAPDVDPAAPEMPSATLEPVGSHGSTYPGASSSDYVKPLPTTGRGRSGTDYSMREADLAREANTSPETSQSFAEATAIQQNLFLDTHPSNPTSPTVLSPTSGIARPLPLQSSTGSGRNSPAGNSHSRVRNIVSQFHQIDKDSRRNSAASGMSSKSSWSNFAGEDEIQPGIPRRTTGGSALSHRTPDATSTSPERLGRGDVTSPGVDLPSRPAAERLDSFKPHLPGEWISAAPTPASEVPEPTAPTTVRGRDHTSRDITPTPASQELADQSEEIDLTPTTRKTKLHGSEPSADQSGLQNPLFAVKNAGDALGTAFMSSIGYGHQTQDFANKGNAAPVDVPELRPHRETGNIDHHSIPGLRREYSDAPSDGTNSVANSVPPTPPEKDTPMPTGLAANAGRSSDRPVSNYFAGYTPDAPAPLSFGKQSSNNTRDITPTRPTVLPSLSTDTRTTDFESDRLRKDIVRSLGPEQMAEIKRESMLEETYRTQDALDAPANERRIANGQSALPAAEIKNADARSGLPSQSARPGLLGQRFSWENRSTDGSSTLNGHMAVVGELKGDEDRESYERPRSNQGLHVVNTQVVADSEPSTAATERQIEPPFMHNDPADAEQRLSDTLLVGTAALATESQADVPAGHIVSPIAESPETIHRGLDQMAPAPMVEEAEEDERLRATATQSPSVQLKNDSPTSSSIPLAEAQPSTTAQSKIPAFRDLATIKSTEERIAAYESTRHRFADMNTGLSGWLSGMLAAHPEYANAGNQKYEGPAVIQMAGLTNTISGLGGTIRGASHKHSPSILKIGGGERKASTTSIPAAAPTSSSGGGHADVEKMQAKGKDFMKSAGAGAKGLFAKGKSRFGRSGEKVE